MNKVRLKKVSIYIAGILFGLLIVFFFSRSVVFSFYLERKIDRFNRENHAILKVDKAKIRSLSTVLLTGISLKPGNGDTLLTIDSLSASLNFWKLIFGRIMLQELELNKTHFSFKQLDSITNYQFLLKGRKQRNSEDSLEMTNYSAAFSRLSAAVFEKIPALLKIKDLTISHQKNGHDVTFHVDAFVAEHHAFHSPVRVSEGDTVKDWVIAGSLDNEKHSAGFRLYSSVNEKISVPFIGFNYKAAVAFDTLTFRLSEENKGDDLFHLRGMVILKGLVIQQEKISANKVILERLGLEYFVNVGPDYFEMDSTTQVFFNRLSFRPYLRYRPKPTKQITFSIIKPDFPADELFSSLPERLFSNLTGIKVNGNLAFNLDFFVDLSLPDSLRFQVDLNRKHFSVLSYGDADLMKLNESFLYTVFEKGVPAGAFIVGPENPDYRPLDKISRFLQISVLNSEDPGFYQHRGFIPEAFRESIILNIKERRFARGGSTITMQLVKNVFLNRNKTIVRKLEEILLVWLIENQQLCSKERMFEVYLNIIELGPKIYGAKEAAHFYFDKEPSKLTLPESIFIASIIPRPKWFMYAFDETGHLRQSEKDFFHLLSGKMLNKGEISQEDFDKMDPDITLKGPAKLLLRTASPFPVDSLDQSDD